MAGSPSDAMLAHQVRFSNLVSRNIIVDGHRTSIRLEPAMWGALLKIAERENMTVHQLGTRIDRLRDPRCGLTAAIRVFLLAYFQEAATEEGHARAGHGNGRRRLRVAGRYDMVPESRPDPAVV